MKHLGTFEMMAAQHQAAPPVSFASKKSNPLDVLIRAAVVNVVANVRKMGIEQARLSIAQKHPAYNEEQVKLVCRAATTTATTFDEGWAAEVVVAQGADLIGAIIPRSAFAQLAAQGMHLTFNNGDILVADFIPTSAGVFVHQSEPIPVIQGQSTGQLLTRKKAACIVTFTEEMAEGAIETMETILRTRIQESTMVTLDGVLLDDQPADDVRPAGLLNGAVQVTSTGAMQGDLQSLAEEFFALANNHVRNPVLIMNMAQAFAARLQSYRDVIPVIPSPSIPAGTVLMVDAADFACAGGQVPRFEISKEAALHFEDSAPQHINSGAGTTIPVRSLWQEETKALRMILEVDWVMRRPGLAAYMENVHWQLARV
jgi:hypothetical protein